MVRPRGPQDWAMTAPSQAQLEAMVERLCRDSVRWWVTNVKNMSDEERALMLLGLANPTEEFERHMEEVAVALADLLETGAVIAMNGLSGHGFVLGDEAEQD